MEVLPCQNEYFIIHLTFRCVLSDDYTKTESTAAEILPSGTKCDQTDLPVTSKHLRSTQERRTVMIICRRSLLSAPPPSISSPPLHCPLLGADNSQVWCWDVDYGPGCKNSPQCFCVSLHYVSGVCFCLWQTWSQVSNNHKGGMLWYDYSVLTECVG